MVDVRKEMTFEEVKNFFSATDEYTVEDLSTNDNPPPYLRVTFTELDHKCSSLMSTRINIQLLIRKVHQLTYNMAVKNYD